MTLDSNNTVDLRSKEVLWTGKIVYIDIYIVSFFQHMGMLLLKVFCVISGAVGGSTAGSVKDGIPSMKHSNCHTPFLVWA